MIKYSLIPYAYNGRGFDGCDCYGLAILYYAEELGINLLDYDHGVDDFSAFTDSVYIIERAHKEFIKVDAPQAHDVVLICNDSQYPNHCGIVLGKTFLHTLEGYGCLNSKLRLWSKRIYGFYRHKDFA